MYKELYLEWPNRMTDKLPSEIHMKQLTDQWLTTALFSFEKKEYKLEKNITSGFELYPPDFNRDENNLKAY